MELYKKTQAVIIFKLGGNHMSGTIRKKKFFLIRAKKLFDLKTFKINSANERY